MSFPEVIKRLLSPLFHPSPLIAFLTDFGLSDHYVGTVKAVVASIHPGARVIDISHEVRPQQVREGAYLLWAAYKFFPTGTIFVAVVDPGVGTGRRILAVKTEKYLFLAPDNGVLDFVLSDEPVLFSIEVNTSESPYVLSGLSRTFHGRDVFAPVAAYLSRGVDLSQFGKHVSLQPGSSPFFVPGEQNAKPAVLLIDRFGNIVTNIRVGGGRKTVQNVKIGSRIVNRWTESYQQSPPRKPCLIVGSSGLVEIVMKNGSAAALLKATQNSPVKVRVV